MITDSQLLRGPTFSVRVPAGFNIAGGDPSVGWYSFSLPPGSYPFNAQGQLQIRAIPQVELAVGLQRIYALNDPNVVLQSYAFMGLASVTNLTPIQQTTLPQGPAYVLQFDGFLMSGLPIRVMDLIIQGPAGGVEVFLSGNPFRWAELTASGSQLLTGIQLVGEGGAVAAPPAAPVSGSLVSEIHQTQVSTASHVAGSADDRRVETSVHVDHLMEIRVEKGGKADFSHLMEMLNQTITRDDHSITDDHSTHVGGNVSGTGNAVGSNATGHVSDTQPKGEPDDHAG